MPHQKAKPKSRTIVESGANPTYTTNQQPLRNIQNQVVNLQAKIGEKTKTTQARNFMVRIGRTSVYLPALRVLLFKYNLVCVWQLAQKQTSLTKGYVYLSPPTRAKTLGHRTAHNM